ncbi:putative Ig domain-containing protein [Paracoccus beibuensis]|uniref:putative Ig domain-containing protein n=1 Tax=Paracoccus beibuensis TaxID=547602 RepID=UPI0022404DF7|nr:putative Ig domain-containing protein [Paracoccus beibuensis]
MHNIVYLEEYATAGNELNLNADFVVPVDADDYVVYVWGTEFNPGTVVQATVKCAADEPAIPSIAGLSPSAGNTAGGSSVVLTGTNLTGVTGVTFGGTAATSYSVNSDTQITATTPAHAAGPVHVAVTTPGATTILYNAYTYIPSSDATLSNIWIGSGTLTPTFAAETTQYSVLVPAATNSVWLNADTTDPRATYIAGGLERQSGSSWQVTLVPGDNIVEILGKAEDGTIRTYTVTITREAPVLALSPAPGTPLNAMAGIYYNQTITTSGGTAPYSYAVTAGALPVELTLDTSGTISGTPTVAGEHTFTVTATDAQEVTGSVSYTIAVAVQAPVAGHVTATVAANSADNAITLDLSGGAATSVAVLADPAHGTATVSGTTITYTPNAGYSGSDSFTYTATNASGTSAAAIVSLTVTAPTLAFAPKAGALPDGTAGTAYSMTVAASQGTAPYTYAVTAGALPAGLSLDTSGTISGTPTVAGEHTFTVTATDAHQVTGSMSYSIAMAVQAPVAGSVTATVDANSADNAIALNVTGGAATSVAVLADPAHGTATVSGTTITYTPAAGYSGADSFTYTATNASGTSAAATVSLTVTAPALVFAPKAGVLPAGTAGTAYSQTVAASQGTAPYSYAVTAGALPAGLSLDASGTISGTPTVAGEHMFTVTATDAQEVTGSVSYSISVAVQAPVAGNVTATTAANSADNAITLDLSGGAATSVAVLADPAHGTATVSGTTITYTPAAGYSGTDSFTYTATNASGTSDAATVSLTVTAPTLAFAPKAGVLPAGIAGTAYNQAVAASQGTAPYSYAVTAGALPAGLSLDASGTILGTPTVAGDHTFTVTATDVHQVTGSVSYSISVAVQAPVAGSVTATVAANSADNAITLNVTGGAATSVAVLADPAHGTATVSGTTITYIPAAGYSGSDSFTYTATNASGTSTAATVSLTVTAPALAFAPKAGVLPAGTAGTAYSQAVAASQGTAPYSYAVTAGDLPAGLSLSTSGTLSGTPTVAGEHTFTVTATDAHQVTGSVSYSIAVAVQAPVAGSVTATVDANSADNAIALNVTGGAATSVAVLADPWHGTATVSGTTITYSPAAGYSGTDSFTYTATNASGTSQAATVSVSVTAPTLAFAPATGVLPAGTVSTAYSQVVAASQGTAPYSYAVTAGDLPAGLSLSTSGTISGTPTVAGEHTFTVTATDAHQVTGSVSYSIAVKAAPVLFSFTPATGALTGAMAGEDYSQLFSATGGAGTTTYTVSSGALPEGLVLAASSGELSGTLASNAEGDYTFTVQARDSNGATGAAVYTLKVRERAVTVTDKRVKVAAGSSPLNIDLTRGATGGPFMWAEVAAVVPQNAGRVSIVRGEFAQAGSSGPLGWYLKFIPDPAYSGTVTVDFSLTSALGVSNTGTVIYEIDYDAAEVAADIDGLVNGFVRNRQNMISSTISVPGLLERRRMDQATERVTTQVSPSGQGVKLSFSTSLAQMEAAKNHADGVHDTTSSPFNMWMDGTFLLHKRDAGNGEGGGEWGSFGMISGGADYLLNDKALVGLSLHYDHMTDPSDEDAELTGNGWMAGPSMSFELGEGVFWDTSLLYGGSSNDIDTAFWDGTFRTSRRMFDTSVKGQWKLDETTTLTPKLRAVYFKESVDDYVVSNDAQEEIGVDGFTEEQLRVSFGAEIIQQLTLKDGTRLTPTLGFTGGFSGMDGAGAFGSISGGVSARTPDQWNLGLSLLLNIEGDGAKSAGARASIAKQF